MATFDEREALRARQERAKELWAIYRESRPGDDRLGDFDAHYAGWYKRGVFDFAWHVLVEVEPNLERLFRVAREHGFTLVADMEVWNEQYFDIDGHVFSRVRGK